MREFFIFITNVVETDTHAGDIPNWIFHVTDVDVTISDTNELLYTFKRGGYRYHVCIRKTIATKPDFDQCKRLVRWQHEYILSGQRQAKDYQSWLHRR